MNSKGHLYISLGKSILRIVSAVVTIITKDVLWLASGFGLAEVLGVFEELVDKR